MPKKNLPALPSEQKNKKYTPVSYTEEPTDIHAQKERELERLKADQSELAGITEQLSGLRADPLIMLTQRETVSALEQRAADITGKYGSRSALGRQVAELTQKVNDPKLKYLNSSDFRSQYQRLLDLGAGGQSVQNNFAEAGLEYLTPEERGAYNYHYYKHGKDKADAYLAGIQYDVNSRRAAEIAEGANTKGNEAVDIALKLDLAYKAGLNSAQRDGQHFLEMLAGEDTHSVPSATQMASAQAREQMGEKGTMPLMLYDVAQNMGYETPAILASTVLGTAGKALFADDAFRAGKVLMKAGEYLGNGLMTIPNVGSAYQEALNQGHTKEQAQTMATTVGVVEVAKNALYNKFGKLSGVAAEKAVQTLDGKINNAVTRVLAKFGAKAFLGFTGEYIQTIADKAADNVLLGTNHNIELISEEALYESMVETISGLITEGSIGVFEKANGIMDFHTVAQSPVREVQYSDRMTGTDVANPSSNTRSGKDFSMESLSQKPNIQGKVINANRNVKLLADGSIDKKWIVQKVLSQYEAVQTNSPTPTYYVNVPDIGKNVEVTTKGIVHGFIKSDTKNGKKVAPNALINARASLDLPTILKNSVEVNQSDRGGQRTGFIFPCYAWSNRF